MHLPAGQPTPGTSAIHPTLRAALWSPRQRRPTGAAPPLPYRLQTSGVGWLVAAVVLVGLTLAVFAHGLRGPAVPVTVADDAVVRWLAGLQVPRLHAFLRGLVRGSSWWVLFMLSSDQMGGEQSERRSFIRYGGGRSGWSVLPGGARWMGCGSGCS